LVFRNALTCHLTLLAISTMAGCGGSASVPTCSDQPVIFPWQMVSQQTAWRARDSMAEYSFKDNLWILGGWHDSFEPNPRDSWKSTDGASWTSVSDFAAWTHGDLAGAAVFADRMWMLGGWSGGRLAYSSSTNSVWSSADGSDWRLEATPPWSARLGLGSVVHQGRLWIAGGVQTYYHGSDADLRNDVWSTRDGTTWTQASAAAPWTPRAYHGFVEHAGRLWVIGGGNYLPNYQAHNDVWSSVDGTNWRLETPAAPWSPRIWFSAVSYRGYLWILGGWSSNPYVNHADVWYSRDGRHWARYETGAIQWSARHEHSALVHNNRIWIIGGFAEPLANDVWSLELPIDWTGSCQAES